MCSNAYSASDSATPCARKGRQPTGIPVLKLPDRVARPGHRRVGRTAGPHQALGPVVALGAPWHDQHPAAPRLPRPHATPRCPDAPAVRHIPHDHPEHARQRVPPHPALAVLLLRRPLRAAPLARAFSEERERERRVALAPSFRFVYTGALQQGQGQGQGQAP